MNKNTEIYGLADMYSEVMAMMDDPEVDDQVIIDTLEAIAGEIGFKVDQLFLLTKKAGYIEDMYRYEARLLTERAQRTHAKIDRIKGYVKGAMTIMGVTELPGENITAKIQKNGGVQELKIVDVVPDRFNRVTVEPDKELIRKAIKNGEKIDFAYLEERGTHVRFV